MSTLKTSLKVEASSLFPQPVSFASSTASEITGEGNFGKINLTYGDSSLISTNKPAARGKFLYVSSPSSNPKNSAIELIGNSGDPIATLFSGESTYILLSPEQGNIHARTTFGSASLDYFVTDRGEVAGQSVLLYNYNHPSDNGTWKYYILDSSSAAPSKEFETNYLRSEWDMNVYTIIQDRSYVISFYNRGDDYYVYQLIGVDGTLIEEFNSNGKSNWDIYDMDGKLFGFTWNEGYDWYLKIFDGYEVYSHHFANVSSSVYIEWNDSACAADGTVPVYVEGIDRNNYLEGIYFVRGNQKTFVCAQDYDDTGRYYTSYVDYYHNFCIIEEYDINYNYSVAFRVYDLNGNLLHEMPLDLTDQLSSFYRQWIGSDSFQALLYNGSDSSVPYIMFNYNSKTNKMIGKDKSWTHERGTYYYDAYIYGNSYEVRDPSSFNRNGVAIAFFRSQSINTDYIASNQVDFLDMDYIIDDGDLQRKSLTGEYTIWANLRPNWYNRDLIITPNNKDFSILLTTGDSVSSGTLYQNVFNKTGEFTSIDMGNLEDIYVDYTWYTITSGDYRILFYAGEDNTSSFTRYIVIKGLTKLDTLRINYTSSYRMDYVVNCLIVRDYNPEPYKFYYFNTKTAKWTETANRYYDDNYQLYGTSINGMYSNRMLLMKYVSDIPSNTWKLRWLVDGVLQPEVDITPSNISYNGPWNFTPIIGQNTVAVRYASPTTDYKWIIDVYDYNFSKLYSINTENLIFDWNDYQYINNRVFLRMRRDNLAGNPVDSFYMLGKLINTVDIESDGNNPSWVINDAQWWWGF